MSRATEVFAALFDTVEPMGLFDRLRGGFSRSRSGGGSGTAQSGAPGPLRAPGAAGGSPSPDRAHLEEFLRSRTGVEAYVEPATASTEITVLLVAHNGEFTRRHVPSPDVARKWALELGLPIYDATIVGYPQRYRDFSAAVRKADRERIKKLLED